MIYGSWGAPPVSTFKSNLKVDNTTYKNTSSVSTLRIKKINCYNPPVEPDFVLIMSYWRWWLGSSSSSCIHGRIRFVDPQSDGQQRFRNLTGKVPNAWPSPNAMGDAPVYRGLKLLAWVTENKARRNRTTFGRSRSQANGAVTLPKGDSTATALNAPILIGPSRPEGYRYNNLCAENQQPPAERPN